MSWLRHNTPLGGNIPSGLSHKPYQSGESIIHHKSTHLKNAIKLGAFDVNGFQRLRSRV
jgi:hypothetical protein